MEKDLSFRPNPRPQADGPGARGAALLPTPAETKTLLANIGGTHALMAGLLYGSGLQVQTLDQLDLAEGFGRAYFPVDVKMWAQ